MSDYFYESGYNDALNRLWELWEKEPYVPLDNTYCNKLKKIKEEYADE